MAGITAYFAQHHDYLWFVIAGACLLVELNLLGLGGPLLFIAIGSLITGVLVTLGIVNNFQFEIICVAVFSIANAAILWRPLKKIQNKEVGPETSSDMVGKILPVSARITRDDGRVSYSGIEWLARLDSSSAEPIEKENKVKVTSVDGTILMVQLAPKH
jgi:membrane protein implicated in regulation of membrane protease activity